MSSSKSKRPRRLSLLDATFLQIETRETPMHVAGLQVFQLPDDAPSDFVKRIVGKLRCTGKLARPWNLKLAAVPLSRLAPATVIAHDIDMDYHVRHTCLPSPGGERELGELVSHLHSVNLDRSRPLWTCHVIEGLENGRFALYIKIHHALVDGVRAMHLLTRGLGDEPKLGNWSVPWADVEQPRKEKAKPSKNSTQSLSALAWPRAMGQALTPLLRRKSLPEPIRLPFEAPSCVLNGPVTGARRVATQRFDLAQIKALSKRAEVSVNDIFLAICSAAVRKHLQESKNLPEKSLIAGIPVSLRADQKNADAGNAVGFIWAVLGTDQDDPQARLAAISKSTRASKEHLQNVPAEARNAFTMSTMLPAIAVLLSGQGARVKPSMNLVISNVPGPSKAVYLDQARMEGMFPVSVALQGLGLNITCVSYDGQLTVGFTGSRDSLPHLQRIAVYAGEALEELEVALTAAKTTRRNAR